ncbi:MAG TPA: antitoxin VapB family protein [Thermoplasmata archaeon]|nr:antitoxin VapB family protein [Thermoplasmata archaeon]
MAVKTITVTEDAYAALAALKRGSESFSDVIRRLTKTNRSLLEFAGDWKDIPKGRLREFEEWLKRSDDLSKAKLERVFREMSG